MALSTQEKAFVEYCLQCGNKTEAARKAGYSESMALSASQWLNPKNTKKFKPELAAYFEERLSRVEHSRIADTDEILEFMTNVMRGKEKDQFGLDASLSDRVDVAKALLKRLDAAGKTGGNTTRPKIIRMEDGGIEVEEDEA